jgi:hypothetical protein
MAKFGDSAELVKCSFCGKSQKAVKKLIAGPGVYICDECIELCNEIIDEEFAQATEVGMRFRSRETYEHFSTSMLSVKTRRRKFLPLRCSITIAELVTKRQTPSSAMKWNCKRATSCYSAQLVVAKRIWRRHWPDFSTFRLLSRMQQH